MHHSHGQFAAIVILSVIMKLCFGYRIDRIKRAEVWTHLLILFKFSDLLIIIKYAVSDIKEGEKCSVYNLSKYVFAWA